ncbi:MAG: hypothetical protein PHV25_00840 [Candidatus Pacebacteria bacterium]|nr:hypothetical protein [Candidatus Paceibacterota bacterium]
MKEKIGNFEPSAEYEKTKELIGKTEDKIKEVATLINQTREEGFDIKKINHPYINILSRNIVSRKKMISLFEMNGSEEVLWEGNHSNIEEGIKEIESLIAQMKESGIIISDLYKRYNN